MLNKTMRRFWLLIQLILVLIFIIFEELIWEQIAEPIYDYIHDLHLLQTLKRHLASVNRYVILGVFLLLLFGVEGAGLAAGVLAVRGMVITAALLYGLKIPIAAFTFWLFHATETQLLSFGWFREAYAKILAGFSWIKSREIYRNAQEMFHRIRRILSALKRKYFQGNGPVLRRMKRLYYWARKLLFGRH